MKLAIYDPYLDALGGGEKYMLTLAECLSKNHEVSILWDNEEDIEKIEDRFGLDLSKTKLAPNIFHSRFSFLQRLKESRKYDVIIYLSDGSIPLVLTKRLILHLQFPVEWVTVNWKARLKLKRVNTVIVNSKFTKSFIDRKFEIDSVIVYPPVQIQHSEVKKENMIMHVGRFMKTGVEGKDYKKQYFMIETFKKMVDEGLTNWKFFVCASVRSSDLRDFQKMQASAAGYPIEFVVNATNEELWKYYNKAKIYWHASGFGEDIQKNPERAEHFGISTVEAMGAGAVPVVVNAGGQTEIVTHGKNGLLWDTQEEFIQHTLSLVQDDKKREQLSIQGKNDSRWYNVESFCKHVSQLI